MYTDIRTTLQINRRLGPHLLANAPHKDTKNLQQDSPSQNRCTLTHCCGRSSKGRIHSADNCFIMHPELRNAYTPQKPTSAPVQKKGMLAVGDTTSTMDSKIDGLCAAMQQLKQDLEETKKVIFARRQRLQTDNIPPDKPHYLDSGNNYSVISTLNHIDTDTSYIPSLRNETLETASGQQLAITGTGLLQGVDAIHVPDSVASLTSVSQFNKARNAVSIFFKTEV